MSVISITKENFDQTVDNNELVIIDFWAEWCGPCKSFFPIFEETAKGFPDIVFAQINIEKEKTLADDFEIRSIPLLMVVREGVVVFMESGTCTAAALRELIDRAQKLDMADIHEAIRESGFDDQEDDKE